MDGRWVIGLLHRPVIKDWWNWLALSLALSFMSYAMTSSTIEDSTAIRSGTAIFGGGFLWVAILVPRRLIYLAISGMNAGLKAWNARRQLVATHVTSSTSQRNNRRLPGAGREDEITQVSNHNQTDASRPTRAESGSVINVSHHPESNRGKSKIMVVYGRNEEARRALFEYLRSLQLQPLEWSRLISETKEGSPFVGDVVSRAFSVAQAVVILMTPDERVQLRSELGEEPESYQPRPNVLLEAGMALATHPDRTILVHLGGVRGVSDLEGRHVVRLGAERVNASALHDLASRLENAGCPIDRTGSDWLDVERFAHVRALT